MADFAVGKVPSGGLTKNRASSARRQDWRNCCGPRCYSRGGL